MIALTRTVSAEFRKLLTLPGIWIALAVTVLGSAAITLLNASMQRDAVLAGDTSRLSETSTFESSFAAAPIVGVVGAVVIGSLAIGSEYTADRAESGGARQIATSLSATPNRWLLFTSKLTAVVLVTAASAAVSIPGNYALALAMTRGLGTETVTLDEGVARSLGAALYWVLMGLIAFAITALARSVMIPLAVLVANSSVVPFSILLSDVTPLAAWLPDTAGRKLFGLPDQFITAGNLDTLTGAITMAAWAVALITAAGIVFRRRDA